jgi:hypothetical protein
MNRLTTIIKKIFRYSNYLGLLTWWIIKVKLYYNSKYLNNKVSKVKQKGLFIDCGSNIGQSFEFFQKFYQIKNFDYILFETETILIQMQKKIGKLQYILKSLVPGLVINR